MNHHANLQTKWIEVQILFRLFEQLVLYNIQVKYNTCKPAHKINSSHSSYITDQILIWLIIWALVNLQYFHSQIDIH